MADLIETYERVADGLATHIVKQAHALDEAVGERPYGTEALPERDQVIRYGLVRDDAQAWADLIAEHGMKPATRYAVRMEALRAKYPEEAGYLDPMAALTQPEPDPAMMPPEGVM